MPSICANIWRANKKAAAADCAFPQNGQMFCEHKKVPEMGTFGKTVKFKFYGTGMILVMPVPLLMRVNPFLTSSFSKAFHDTILQDVPATSILPDSRFISCNVNAVQHPFSKHISLASARQQPFRTDSKPLRRRFVPKTGFGSCRRKLC